MREELKAASSNFSRRLSTVSSCGKDWRHVSLLEHLKTRLGLSMLFITHDLRVAAQICDRIAVMQRGVIVELKPTAALFASPEHPYARELLAAVPGQQRPVSLSA
jgi:peptide/nickel transport system ATP-binding protein